LSDKQSTWWQTGKTKPRPGGNLGRASTKSKLEFEMAIRDSIENITVPAIVVVVMLFGWGTLSALTSVVGGIEQAQTVQAEQIKAITHHR
jgi:hypothetical protein